MYDVIKCTIENGSYDLRYMLMQIDEFWLQRAISATERDELIALARQHAAPEDSYAPVEQRVLQLETALRELEARVAAIEAGSGSGSGSEEPSSEWPAYTDPTGAHDAYMTGDKVTFNERHYICQMDNCVWSPAVLPSAWQEVTNT